MTNVPYIILRVFSVYDKKTINEHLLCHLIQDLDFHAGAIDLTGLAVSSHIPLLDQTELSPRNLTNPWTRLLVFWRLLLPD